MGWFGRSVLLRSSLNQSSGYGRDGVHLAQALIEAGADVHLEPLLVYVPLPREITELMHKPRDRRYDLMLHHTDPKQLAATPGLRRATDLVVAMTMWEFLSMRGEDFEDTLTKRLENYSTILAYDETSHTALREFYHGDLRTLQGGYRAEEWEEAERDWSGTFRFLMVGALGPRKNPFAAIEAFKSLKTLHGSDFDAELVLKNVSKTLHPSIEQWVPGVRIIYDIYDHAQMTRLYQSCHCYLSSSWGEGKNVPALEAATTGMPVILSECGGHKQWFDRSIGWMLSHSTLAAHDPVNKPEQLSLRVSVEELAARMWFAYTHRGEARRKGENGARLVPSSMDWSVTITRLDAMLAT